MRRIESSSVIVLILSIFFISAGEAMAAKVTVEYPAEGLNCEYDVALWYTDQTGKRYKTAPVYFTPGGKYTFDSGSSNPYMLDGSACLSNHKKVAGRALMRRGIDTVSGDSNWKIGIVDNATCGFSRH